MFKPPPVDPEISLTKITSVDAVDINAIRGVLYLRNDAGKFQAYEFEYGDPIDIPLVFLEDLSSALKMFGLEKVIALDVCGGIVSRTFTSKSFSISGNYLISGPLKSLNSSCRFEPLTHEHLSISPQIFSMTTFPKSPRFPLVHHSTPIQSYNYPEKSQIPRWTHAINKIPTRPPTPYHHNVSFSSILNNVNQSFTLDDLKDESMSSILEKRRKNFQRDDLIELIGLLEIKVKGLEIAYRAAREESEFCKQIIDKHES